MPGIRAAFAVSTAVFGRPLGTTEENSSAEPESEHGASEARKSFPYVSVIVPPTGSGVDSANAHTKTELATPTVPVDVHIALGDVTDVYNETYELLIAAPTSALVDRRNSGPGNPGLISEDGIVIEVQVILAATGKKGADVVKTTTLVVLLLIVLLASACVPKLLVHNTVDATKPTGYRSVIVPPIGTTVCGVNVQTNVDAAVPCAAA